MLTYQPVNLSTFPSGEGTLIQRGKQEKGTFNEGLIPLNGDLM